MIDINPFCDSDIRNGLQFLSGVNLIIIFISLIVDGLAIFELTEFGPTWEPETFYLPMNIGISLLGSDILANFLLLFCGWVLCSSVTQKSYGRISRLFYPLMVILAAELGIVASYLACIPSSPFFYYFSLFTFLYKAFLLWPMKKFINDHSHHHHQHHFYPPRHHFQRAAHLNERSRLLASVG